MSIKKIKSAYNGYPLYLVDGELCVLKNAQFHRLEGTMGNITLVPM